MGAVFGDLQGAWLGHIEDLSTDGRAVTVGVRQRCAAARTGGGVMIHNMVRALGPRQRRSLVARLPPLGLPDLPRWLRVRLWVPLFLRRPSLAGGLLLVVLSSAALRSSSAMRSRRVAFSRSSAAFSRTSAVARRNSPWPHSRKALTTVVAKDEGSRRSCRHAKASSWAARSSCQRDSVTGPRHRRPSWRPAPRGVRPPARPCNAGPSWPPYA